MNIVLITSILFTLAIAIAAVSSHILLAEEATKAAQNKLEASIKDIEKTLLSIEFKVKDASEFAMRHIENGQEDRLYRVVRRIVEEDEHINGSAIAFRKDFFKDRYYYSPFAYMDNGEVKTKQLGNQDYDYFHMDWFQIPELLGEPVWSEPYYDEGGGNVLMSTYSLPLKDDEGNVVAIMTADVTLEWLTDIISSIKSYDNSYSILISRSGAYIASGDNRDYTGETLFSNALDSNTRGGLELARAMTAGESGHMIVSEGATASFVVFGQLENGWKAATFCLYKEVLKRASTMHLIIIFIGLLGLISVFIFCHRRIKKLTKPLSEITSSAKDIAKGNFHSRLPEISTEDEIKELRDSFENMQSSLTAYINELQTTTAENERFESELNIASAIQMGMLPTDFPVSERVDLFARLIPAKEVGGDLYDFYLKDNRLYFAVGDVSGKGVPASLVMAITRSAFKFISGMGLPLNEVVSKINNMISEGNSRNMFVTLFVGKLHLDTGLLEYCNAGHNPIIINGEFLSAKPNLAVGLFPDFPYVLQTITLEKGSNILLYTDGVSEAENAAKDQYGDARLLEWSRQNLAKKDLQAKDKIDSLYASIREFTAGAEQNDDITMMEINYKK